MQRQAELKAAVGAELPADLTDDDASPSLAELRRLMRNPATPLSQRVDCAATILAFELAPGAAVGVDTDRVGASSFRFLRSAADSASTPAGLKLKCLQLLAGIENARAGKNAIADNQIRRELFVRMVNAERHRALLAAGAWRRALGETWSLAVGDEFALPERWRKSWQWPPVGSLVAALDRRGDVAALRSELLAVRARNRDDDWERFLTVSVV
jgi:hypothetical protein